MLNYLAIDNYVLLSKVRLNFDSNLIAISGETGSGKSLLLETLNLVVGGKLSKNAKGPFTISASFDISNNTKLIKLLKNKDIDIDDDNLIIKRVVKENNKSYFYLQGMPIRVSEITEISNLLIHIVGQNSNKILYDSSNQIKLLDNFIDDKVLLDKVKDSYNDYKKLEQELLTIEKENESYNEKISYLNFIKKELDSVDLNNPNEDIEILDRLNIIKDSAIIFENLNKLKSAYYGNNDFSISSKLKDMRSYLRKLNYIENPFNELEDRINSAILEIDDIVSECENQLNSLSYSETEVDKLNSRLSKLQNLMRLYGPTLEQVIEKKKEVNKSLENSELNPERIKKLKKILKEKQDIYILNSKNLHNKRIEFSKKLERVLTESLRELDMKDCSLKISIEDNKYTNLGYDKVDFLIKTNTGTSYAKLEEIASGGEISRILLALLSVLSEKDDISTIIFDEIDTGIGGKISHSVANKIEHISLNKQVFVVTHLATVASKAYEHILISKNTSNNKTTSYATLIDGDDRVVEIARMLSGHSQSTKALEHAKELLKREV